MTALNQDFSMFAGDSRTLKLSVYGDNVNLIGASIVWEVKRTDSSEIVLTKSTDNEGIEIIDSTHFFINLFKTDTQNLQDVYCHKAKMVDNDGNYSTLFTGEVEFT